MSNPTTTATSRTHPLVAAELDCSPREQIARHLAGQFDWLISCVDTSATHDGSPSAGYDGRAGPSQTSIYYLCNLLSRQPRSSSTGYSEDQAADTYTLIATPLDGHVFGLQDLEGLGTVSTMAGLARADASPRCYDASRPLPPSQFMEGQLQTLSPALSFVSDRGSSFADRSSRGGSFSLPRIEDSLAELDKLEDELEAFDAAASGRRTGMLDRQHGDSLESPSVGHVLSAPKRASVRGQAATVRVKASDKSRPVLRRAASLNLREKNDRPIVRQDSDLRQDPFKKDRSPATTAQVKSAKAPRVPDFELPGEAVSRRLKEQREARRARQAEAEKAAAAAPSTRCSKPLTRPTFELPGEAISRRKRDEREARVKAQEEEDRRRREFKARPIRHVSSPGAFVRETITSRARQSRAPEGQETPRLAKTAAPRRSPVSVRPSGRSIATASGSRHSQAQQTATMTRHNVVRVPGLAPSGSAGTRRRAQELFAHEPAGFFTGPKEMMERERRVAGVTGGNWAFKGSEM